MTRLKALIAAAALLVVGGLTIPSALRQAAEELDPPMTCAEWCTATTNVRDRQQHEVFFVALEGTTLPPPAFGERLIGTCAAGECRIEAQGCAQCAVVYSYELFAATNGWRLFEIRAPLYVAGSLKTWAASTASAHFFGGWAQLVDQCVAVFGGPMCRQLAAGHQCWLLGTEDCGGTPVNRVCRYGRLYGCGRGGDEACVPDAGSSPIPCVVDRGAGSELEDAARVWTDEELDTAAITGG